MSNEIIKQSFSLEPTNFEQAMQYAKIIATSSFCPKNFINKPHDVLIAIQMGNELGLKPIQAIQNIAVINGKPTIWGDAMWALVVSHPECEWVKETQSDTEAVCIIKRKGNPEHTSIFTKEDARKAGLIGKPGPWSAYEKRMMQMRARGFGARDVFPDALRGIISREEAEDYPEVAALDKARVANSLAYAQRRRTTEDSLYEDIDYDADYKIENEKLLKVLNILIEELPLSEDRINALLRYAKVKKLEDLTNPQLSTCIQKLEQEVLEKRNNENINEGEEDATRPE